MRDRGNQIVLGHLLLFSSKENDLLLRLLYRPGDFIAFYQAKELSESIKEDIQSTFTLGTRRLRLRT
jgi:hypothetical protein